MMTVTEAGREIVEMSFYYYYYYYIDVGQGGVGANHSDYVEVRGQFWESTLESSYTWKGPKVPGWIRAGEMALWVEVPPSGV